MLYADYRDNDTWASEFPKELAALNTCEDGLEHYPRCPECDARVTHRTESETGRAAHFAHCPSSSDGGGGGGGSGCNGAKVGESEKHKAMKSIATSAIEFALESVDVAETRLEATLPAPYSENEKRRADSLLVFSESDQQLGDGLVIEVQYENKTKDKAQTTWDYIRSGYSVIWLWEKDFHTDSDLPKDWNCKLVHENTVRDRVRRQIWPANNKDSIWKNSGEVVSPASNLQPAKTEQFIKEVDNDTNSQPPKPKIAGTAIDSIADEYRNGYTWDKLFNAPTSDELVEDLRREFGLPKTSVPATFRIVETGGPADCPRCGHSNKCWPRAAGEIRRGKTCRNCGEWFTVFDRDNAVKNSEVFADD